MTSNILIYIEIHNGKVEQVCKEIISYAIENFNNSNIIGVVVGDSPTINSAIEDLQKLALKKIYLIKHQSLFRPETNLYAISIKSLLDDIKPDVFLVGATISGREIAPRIASKLNIGLTADCTELEFDENEILLATRPTYGGKMMAVIYSKTKPYFATIRPGAFKITNFDTQDKPELINYAVELPTEKNRIEMLKSELRERPEDWTKADIIVAGGAGLKSKENFDLIYKFAEKINAKAAASRVAVEKGWAPPTIQVGQTGSSVSPKLYIAFGISGAMQHIVGITNSDKIIAINTDKSAPIMELADIPINDDAIATLKQLISDLN